MNLLSLCVGVVGIIFFSIMAFYVGRELRNDGWWDIEELLLLLGCVIGVVWGVIFVVQGIA